MRPLTILLPLLLVGVGLADALMREPENGPATRQPATRSAASGVAPRRVSLPERPDARGALTLWGRGAARPRPVTPEMRPTAESPQHASMGSVEDPWGSKEDLFLPAKNAPAPSRQIVSRLRPADGGGVNTTHEPLRVTIPDGRQLIAYDVAALLMHGHHDGVGLAGHNFETESLATGSLHLFSLAAEMLTAAGRSSWQEPGTMLALDEQRATLYIRQDDEALTRIEAFLDRCQDRHSMSTPLHVDFFDTRTKRRLPHLQVDLPGGARVKAFQGVRWTHVMDYDVEISMGSWLGDPILGDVECGVGLAARWVPTSNGEAPNIELNLAYGPGSPRFELDEAPINTISCGAVEVHIEIAQTDPLRWQGQVAGVRGTHVELVLSDEVTCEISVGEPRRAPLSRNRAWRRRTVTAADSGSDVAPAILIFELTGSVSGVLGRSPLTLSHSQQAGGVMFSRTSAAWQRAQSLERAVRPVGLSEQPDQDPVIAPRCGGAYLDLLGVDCILNPHRLDLCIEASEWTGEARTVQVHTGGFAGELRVEPVRLPSAHAWVTCRRVELSPAGAGSLTFGGDLGAGPEQFTLSIWRR